MKFRSDEDGFITALRFYKQPNNIGHARGAPVVEHRPAARRGRVHGRDGLGLAGGGAARAGARSAKDTTYITSYHSSQGQFGFSPGYFSRRRRPARRCTLCPTPSPAATASTATGPSAFPDSTFNATNYWVDAVLNRLPPADTRAPLVSSVQPGGRRDRRAERNTSVTATFDEPLDPLTVNAGSFTLAGRHGQPRWWRR